MHQRCSHLKMYALCPSMLSPLRQCLVISSVISPMQTDIAIDKLTYKPLNIHTVIWYSNEISPSTSVSYSEIEPSRQRSYFALR